MICGNNKNCYRFLLFEKRLYHSLSCGIIYILLSNVETEHRKDAYLANLGWWKPEISELMMNGCGVKSEN